MSDFFKYLEQRIADRGQEQIVNGKNTKTPIYNQDDQKAMYDQVVKTLPGHYSLFWRIAVSTGWRTSDIARLQHSAIDLDAGTCTIVVAKQTRTAQKRAFNGYLRSRIAKIKELALAAGDMKKYEIADNCEIDDLAVSKILDPDQVNDFYKALETAVLSAPVKTDTKYLPADILPILADMADRNIFDDYVFSRRMLAESNRAKNLEGHITRQAIHKAFKSVFDWFMEQHQESDLKLSAYSLRKTFAYRVYRGPGGNGANMGEVQELFGHSSPDITKRYLGLDVAAGKLQREMARAV